MQFTISGYSTALFSTWYFVEELGLLLDAGDGVTSNLLQKSRKIKSVFISHADRDHLTGLLQLNQLNARPGLPKIYYPEDAKSIAALEKFSKNFDTQVSETEWVPLGENQETEIKKNIIVTPVKNNHVVAPHSLAKSFGYKIQSRKYKLKKEYLSVSKNEIIRLRKEKGDDFITQEVRENVLGYSGDTPVENFQTWNHCQILIHEATFLYKHDISDNDTRRNKHSVLEDVLKAAAEIKVGHLILGHFSSRYSNIEIDECIKKCCSQYNITFPVSRLLPGQYYYNICSSTIIS